MDGIKLNLDRGADTYYISTENKFFRVMFNTRKNLVVNIEETDERMFKMKKENAQDYDNINKIKKNEIPGEIKDSLRSLLK